MKKSYTLFFAFLLSFLIIPLVQANGPFLDVSENHPNIEAISKLKDLEIIQGFPDGNFYSDEPLTRAQLVKMAYLAQAKNSDEIGGNEISEYFPFNNLKSISLDPPVFDDLLDFRADPNIPEWFEYYVSYGKQQGLLKGYEGNVFKPLKLVNFVEATKIITLVFGFQATENPIWYKPYVENLANKGAIPTSIQSFNQPITRVEMSEIIYRLITQNTIKSSQSYESIFEIEEATLQKEILCSKMNEFNYTIILLIDADIYEGAKNSVERFSEDLKCEGYEVIIEVSDMQNPEEVRDYLKEKYDTVAPKLTGAFLIGNIPRPYYYVFIPATDTTLQRGPEEHISFQFYQDLDGIYSQSNPDNCQSQGCYDSHTGETCYTKKSNRKFRK